jgi:hypothetical protein
MMWIIPQHNVDIDINVNVWENARNATEPNPFSLFHGYRDPTIYD